MNKLSSIVILVSVNVLLSGCGKKHNKSTEPSQNLHQREIYYPNASQRFTVHSLNDHQALIIDQQTGKIVKLGFSSSSWNSDPQEIKIDWEKK